MDRDRWTERNENGEPFWLWAGALVVLGLMAIAGMYFMVVPALGPHHGG